MALSILDGTQTATTLSTILSSGQHITAHTVVSLGSQAISDITSAVSSGISISGTVTANLGLMQSVVATEGVSTSSTFVKIGGHQDGANTTGHIAHVSSGGALKVDGSGSTQPISGTITIGNTVTIAGTVTANPTGTQTIAGSVTIGAGTSQIGSVTASISGTVPVSGTFFQATQPVSLATLPSLVAGTAQIGSVTVGNSITIGSIVTHGVTIANTSVTVNGTFYQATQPVSLATLPSLVASTAQIGSVTASISGTIPISITSVTIGNSLTIGSIVTHGVTIANTSVTVNGTFYQATQPISISSVTIGNFPATQPVSIASVTIGNSVTIGSLPQISVLVVDAMQDGNGNTFGNDRDFPISGTVTIGSALPAGTAQIGSVTASLSNYNIFSSDEAGAQPDLGIQLGFSTQTEAGEDYVRVAPSNPLPVVANAGDTSFFVTGLDVYAHRSVLYSSSGNGFNNDDGAPVDIYNPLPIVGRAYQGTSVTTSNFTSTTASTVLAGYDATRQVLTIFNEGAGNLHVCAGATCTTIAYQVRLSSGDYYEAPSHQTTITHSAVFATAGTARVTQVS